jgi:type IV pilus assembly protein PilB
MACNISSTSELINLLERPTASLHHPIGEILLRSGVITAKQLTEALRLKSTSGNNTKLGKIIFSLGYASQREISEAISLNLNIPFVNLQQIDVEPLVADFLPASFSRAHNLVPILKHKDRLVVAMEEPTDNDTIKMLHFMTGHMIEPVLATPEDIEVTIGRVYGPADDEQVLKEMPMVQDKEELAEYQAKKLAEDKPTVRLVQNLILDAINRKASDIHIRPKEHDVDIIFRIDGTLTKIRSVPKSVLSAIVSRIKIIGGMNIAERRIPQDGRTKIRTHDKNIDLRISVMPSIRGESVVIRILDTSAGLKSLSEIGFTAHDESIFRTVVQKSAGLILVTGPTGSGKSTTLYAALQEIIYTNINIITVEDPVEYHIDDITQIQVNNATGYTFARALRNILRHDPDAIMIGEIRDAETAKMAIESSLTGHLVLSTLHTNSAATAITRLLEIGVPSYLVSSTLLAILAQRLVKRNCPHCLAEEEVSNSIREALQLSADEKFYKGAGCNECRNTGYNGRMAVYELIIINDELRTLIKPDIDAKDIEALAIRNGMINLTRQALNVARAKGTSLAEVYRVRLD